jgi:predicted esterase
MESHNFITQKTARFYTIGSASERVNRLWICLHGYGELAYYFGRKFRELEADSRLIVIPEGLNRFYLEGTEGRVGASWMTKEERLSDIEDQFRFLEKLAHELKPRLAADCKIHVFGFSQGVATALRWIDKSALPFSSLICWAGSFPLDIDYKLQAAKFSSINFHACFGDDDEYISTENAQKLLEQIQNQGIKVTPHFYKGGHKIYPELLAAVFKSCTD